MSVAGTGTGVEMGGVYEDDELEPEADIVSLSSERDSGYASSGRAIAGAGKGTPPSISTSESVSPSSTILESSIGTKYACFANDRIETTSPIPI